MDVDDNIQKNSFETRRTRSDSRNWRQGRINIKKMVHREMF